MLNETEKMHHQTHRGLYLGSKAPSGLLELQTLLMAVLRDVSNPGGETHEHKDFFFWQNAHSGPFGEPWGRKVL